MRVLDMLFEASPYAGFDAATVPADMQGWGSDSYLFEQVITAIRPARILEVGSWKGRSAINMATVVRKLELSCEIVCVDTWLGSPEHWLKHYPGWYESLRIANGFPKLYETFLANVVREGFSDVITPFPSTSANAAVVLRQLGLTFDLIYLDAAHEYEAVKSDLAAYWDLLAEDGVFMGDDYLAWPGVTRATNEFAAERTLALTGEIGKFVLTKGRRTARIALSA